MKRTISSLPLAILILASLILIGRVPSKKSPSGCCEGVLNTAANEGEFSELEETISEATIIALKSHLGQLGGGIKGTCDRISRNGSIIRVEITKEEIRGARCDCHCEHLFQGRLNEEQ